MNQQTRKSSHFVVFVAARFPLQVEPTVVLIYCDCNEKSSLPDGSCSGALMAGQQRFEGNPTSDGVDCIGGEALLARC